MDGWSRHQRMARDGENELRMLEMATSSQPAGVPFAARLPLSAPGSRSGQSAQRASRRTRQSRRMSITISARRLAGAQVQLYTIARCTSSAYKLQHGVRPFPGVQYNADGLAWRQQQAARRRYTCVRDGTYDCHEGP
jgi:hypothetical protein